MQSDVEWCSIEGGSVVYLGGDCGVDYDEVIEVRQVRNWKQIGCLSSSVLSSSPSPLTPSSGSWGEKSIRSYFSSLSSEHEYMEFNGSNPLNPPPPSKTFFLQKYICFESTGLFLPPWSGLKLFETPVTKMALLLYKIWESHIMGFNASKISR